MRLKQTAVGVLFSAGAIGVTAWALFSTGLPHKHPIVTAGLCFYGCILTPLFILLGESEIEDGVKLAIMFGVGAMLWKAQSWQIAIPFIIPPICGMCANQIIKAISREKKSANNSFERDE